MELKGKSILVRKDLKFVNISITMYLTTQIYNASIFHLGETWKVSKKFQLELTNHCYWVIKGGLPCQCEESTGCAPFHCTLCVIRESWKQSSAVSTELNCSLVGDNQKRKGSDGEHNTNIPKRTHRANAMAKAQLLGFNTCNLRNSSLLPTSQESRTIAIF